MLNINHDRCTRCKICIGNCPFGALSIVDGFLEVSSACTLCGACVNVCPFEALHIERKQIDAEELRKYKGVLFGLSWKTVAAQGRSGAAWQRA